MISQIGAEVPSHYRFEEIVEQAETFATSQQHRVFKSTVDEATHSRWREAASALGSWWGTAKKITDINNEIYMVTRRANKVKEWGVILEGMKLIQADMVLPTWETTNILHLSVARVFDAFKKLQGPCFIEEAALNIDVYAGPYPGHDFRRFIDEGMGKQKFAENENGKNATALSVIAYTKDGKTAHVFTGKMEGKIVKPAQWIEADGYDPYFCPIRNGKREFTLAYLKNFTNLFSARLEPLTRLRTLIRGAQYGGAYEAHITIINKECDDLSKIENCLRPTEEYWKKFVAFCGKRIKPLYITLDDPRKPIQLQTAVYHTYPDYTTAFLKETELAKALLEADLIPDRIRLEAMAKNPESPKTDEEALDKDESNYFEFHASLQSKIEDPVRMELYNSILAKYTQEGIGSHKQGSVKSVFAKGGPNEEKIFANMRVYKLGEPSAMKLRDDLYLELEENGFKIRKKVAPEYTVYDQVPTLDAKLLA